MLAGAVLIFAAPTKYAEFNLGILYASFVGIGSGLIFSRHKFNKIPGSD